MSPRTHTYRRFVDQVAVVTGGGSGIGEATAKRLADEGARVVIIGRNGDKLAKAVAAFDGDVGKIVAHVADVADEQSAAAAIEFAVRAFGRLDVVVNNASRNEYGTLVDTSAEAWRSSFAVNVDGAYFLARAAAPHLTSTRGSIVNVGSDSAFGADPQHAAYNVSKGALVQLTNTLAVDHGSQFRTNAVHPTFTRGTEMTAEAERHPGIVAAFEKAIPVGRAGTPDDIAAAICFLASTDAAFVNGAHLMVDGGLSARTAHPDFSSVL